LFHPAANPLKIALVLEESGLPYEVVPIGERHLLYLANRIGRLLGSPAALVAPARAKPSISSESRPSPVLDRHLGQRDHRRHSCTIVDASA
jgi:hypothetical protein